MANIAAVVELLEHFDYSLGIVAELDSCWMLVHCNLVDNFAVADIAELVADIVADFVEADIAVVALVEPSKLPIFVLRPRPLRQSSFEAQLVYLREIKKRE